jgi:hypothetical protein
MKVEQKGQYIRISATEEEIDRQTVEQIRRRYSLEDELKLHRLALQALITGAEVPKEVLDYMTFIESHIVQAKTKKQG